MRLGGSDGRIVKKTRSEITEFLECDGCKYVLGLTTEQRDAGVEIEETIATLIIPWGGAPVEFHFHVQRGRNDCFRYWAHNPPVMKFSLEERDWEHKDIQEFMTMFLYTDKFGGPGVAREAANS